MVSATALRNPALCSREKGAGPEGAAEYVAPAPFAPGGVCDAAGCPLAAVVGHEPMASRKLCATFAAAVAMDAPKASGVKMLGLPRAGRPPRAALCCSLARLSALRVRCLSRGRAFCASPADPSESIVRSISCELPPKGPGDQLSPRYAD